MTEYLMLDISYVPCVYIFLLGDIATVINLEYFFGITSGINSTCSSNTESHFNPRSGLATLKYSASEFAKDASCVNDVNMEYLGYIQQYDFDVFEVEYDIVSAIICVAVNSGIIKFDDLSRVEEEPYIVTFQEQRYYHTRRVEYNYVGMTPLLCFESMSADGDLTGYNFCLVNIGDTAVLPYFTHFYGCHDCEVDAADDSYCQYFDFLVGGMFFPLPPMQPTTDDDYSYSGAQQNSAFDFVEISQTMDASVSANKVRKQGEMKRKFESEEMRKFRRHEYRQHLHFKEKKRHKPLVASPATLEQELEASADTINSLTTFHLNDTDSMSAMLDFLSHNHPRHINDLVYNAAFDATSLRQNDPQTRKELFAFCTSDRYGSCSLLTFNAYDFNRVVSEYYHSVTSMACRDTFTTTDAAWASLTNNPPTDFVQDYYACKAKPVDAIFNSMGIAAG